MKIQHQSAAIYSIELKLLRIAIIITINKTFLISIKKSTCKGQLHAYTQIFETLPELVFEDRVQRIELYG